MVRSALSKVAWVGGTASTVLGLALVLALVLGVATMALAAVPGDPFKLGRINTINAMTQLVGRNSFVMLKVDNNGMGSALGLEVEQGEPPLRVNSSKKVPNLNADKVDGQGFACPGGTLFHEGACIEVAKRPASATLINAERDCPDEGKRLPTVAELQTFRIGGGHDFTGQFVHEWTSARDIFGETHGASVVYTDGEVGWSNITNPKNYRCVTFAS